MPDAEQASPLVPEQLDSGLKEKTGDAQPQAVQMPHQSKAETPTAEANGTGTVGLDLCIHLKSGH